MTEQDAIQRALADVRRGLPGKPTDKAAVEVERILKAHYPQLVEEEPATPEAPPQPDPATLPLGNNVAAREEWLRLNRRHLSQGPVSLEPLVLPSRRGD